MALPSMNTSNNRHRDLTRSIHRRHISTSSSTLFRLFSLVAVACVVNFVGVIIVNFFQESSLMVPTTNLLAQLPDHDASSTPKWKFVVVAPTFYTTTDETRYLLGLEACRQAAKYGISLILIDASPSEDIKTGLTNAGILRASSSSLGGKDRSFVQVVTQTSSGKKGVALREGIEECLRQLRGEQGAESAFTTIIGFQELEKVDMFRHWTSIIRHMVESGADVTAVRREDDAFKSSYPIEQYHCESFANMFLDSLGTGIGLPSIDWTSGPIAFRTSQAHHWMNYDGETWDAQLVPLVNAHMDGAKVTSYEVDYYHPVSMKQQEQGVVAWNEKRLYQLNVLSQKVGQRMKQGSAQKIGS